MKNERSSFSKKVCSVLVLTMIISIFSVMSFVPSQALGENLLAGLDPSFETADWAGTGWGGGLQDTSDKVTGTYSMMVAASVQASKWINGNAPFPLKGSTRYTLSIYIKTLVPNENKVDFGIVAKDGGFGIPDLSTSVYDDSPTFTKRSFTFDTPKNVDLLIDPYNNFGITINSISDVLVDDIALVEVGPAPTPPPKSTSVTLFPITDKTTVLVGKAMPATTTFTVKYGSTTKYMKASATGLWSIKLSKPLPVGTKITITFKKTAVYYVPASAPTLNALTTKSAYITGKTYKLGKLIILIGSKAINSKSTATGAIKYKLTKKLTKGTKVKVCVIKSGQTSKFTTVTVK